MRNSEEALIDHLLKKWLDFREELFLLDNKVTQELTLKLVEVLRSFAVELYEEFKDAGIFSWDDMVADIYGSIVITRGGVPFYPSISKKTLSFR